jgi:hypothetical protein
MLLDVDADSGVRCIKGWEQQLMLDVAPNLHDSTGNQFLAKEYKTKLCTVNS